MLNNEMLQKAQKNQSIIIDKLTNFNLFKLTPNGNTLLKISATYDGIWLEHSYDAVIYANLFPEQSYISINQINAFLDYQLDDGHIPYSIQKEGNEMLPFYSQIQECVSFVQVCIRAIK